MLHDLAFADANRPAPVRVLRLVLKPYSIEHEIRLRAARNPLLLLPEEEFNGIPTAAKIAALKNAVMICENDSAALRNLETPTLFNWRIRWHRFKLKLAWLWLSPNEYPIGIAEFRNYLRAGTTCPYLIPPQESGRAFGGPLTARLVQFLVFQLGKSEEQALDYPYGAACWHYFVWNEAQGNVNIINETELDFERWCAEQEKKAAAEPQPSDFRPPTSGLATPAPDLTTQQPPEVARA